MKNSLRVRNAMCQAFLNDIDSGTGPGKMRLYTSPQPATGGAAITSQILLGECVFSDPSGAAPVGGVATLSPVSNDVSADASGVIAWCRILDSDNNFVTDLTAGITGSGAEVTFNTNEALAGGIIQITSATFTQPA